MTFSYLRAYANTKKNSLLNSYIVSVSSNIALAVCLFLPTTTLQLFLLYLQLISSLLLFIAGSISESSIHKALRLKKYKILVDFVQVYNFRDKYKTVSDLYNLIGVGLVIANMIVLGWIWQPIALLFFTVFGLINFYDTINSLPEIVSKFNLKEEDFV